MKKLFILCCLVSVAAFGQTDGINYQSVIIDPTIQEIPGVDVTGNFLFNQALDIRFTILDENGSTEYQEVQSTQSDAFGMINVVIGQGTSNIGNYTTIIWDGFTKSLKVEIQLTQQGREFELQEEKELLFLPYAFHRDIIATQTLAVDGSTNLQRGLIVDGVTNLNNNVAVNNNFASTLTGNLEVDGATTLNNDLTVTNGTPTVLSGTLEVINETTLDETLDVADDVTVNSRLTVDGTTTVGEGLNVFNSAPTIFTGILRVDGEADFSTDVNVNNLSNVLVTGDLSVQGDTVLNNDLTVNGVTNLNNDLRVNNTAPTTLSGTLTVEENARFENNVTVTGATDLEGNLNVNGQNATQLSGTLTVEEITNLNSSLSVNNLSSTNLTGDLIVGGDALFNNDVTIDGELNLNDALFVNNGSASALDGNLTVQNATALQSTLNVENQTSLLDNLNVINGAATGLSGILDVDGITTLKNTLQVENQSVSILSGTLNVLEATSLNNQLVVANQSTTNLSGLLMVTQPTTLMSDLQVLNNSSSTLTGILDVTGTTIFNNTLRVNNGASSLLSGLLDVQGAANFTNTFNVANASVSNLSGSLTVLGESALNNNVNIQGLTALQNDLTVTQNADFNALFTTALTIEDDSPNSIAVFENTNQDTGGTSGDGILIKLGRTHGAYNGAAGTNNPEDYLNVNNPYVSLYQSQITAVGNLVSTTSQSGTAIGISDITALIPTTLVAGQLGSIGNSIIGTINSAIGLPAGNPAIAFPATVFSPEITIFPGTSELCTGQFCFNPCTFFNCTICIPPIEFCVPGIPRLFIPELSTNAIPIVSANGLFTIPAIPALLPEIGSGDALLSIPNVTFSNVSNSMSSENTFMSFTDSGDRQTGAIVAQSAGDFLSNTILDPVYVINVLAGFVGVDLVEGIIGGGVEISNLIETFNQIGVSYESGHGDYAEWLPREIKTESMTAGDIVAVNGGKITKDISQFEQILVVSHNPIVLGNNPDDADKALGNPVAFLGQVPVKVIGPVSSGDFIIANTVMKGYGKAISEENMQPLDYTLAVGRSWETNLNDGPKLVRIVMGIHTPSLANEIGPIEEKQEKLDVKINTLEERLKRIADKLQTPVNKDLEYASSNKK